MAQPLGPHRQLPPMGRHTHPLTIQEDIGRGLCDAGCGRDFHLRAAGAVDIDGNRVELLGIDQEGERAIYIDRRKRNVVYKNLDHGWPTRVYRLEEDVDDVRGWVLAAEIEWVWLHPQLRGWINRNGIRESDCQLSPALLQPPRNQFEG